MKNIIYIITTTLYLCALLLPINSFCQTSKNISTSGNNLGFFELKIVETDPLLKEAKETIPFDKPFFIKIKRPDRGPLIGTRIETTENTVGNVKTTDKFESTVTKVDSNKPSEIDKIQLKCLNSDLIIPIGSPNPITGKDFFEEKNSSEFVYIKLPSLLPESGYELTIGWTTKSDEVYSITTVPQSLDKRLKNRISPQIGLAFPVFKVSGSTNDTRRLYVPPRLMVGAYYHPRPIDPDLPFKSYKPWALQRFSLYLGLTINSLAEDNLREDLFGSNNLLLGVGYQPADALRLTVGNLYFTEINPNRLLSNRKSIEHTLFIALSLDIKLKDLLGGLFTTLGFK